MLTSTLAALLALQVGVSVEFRTSPGEQDSAGVELDSATIAGAYADPAARELVRLARERHEEVDLSIRSYQTLAKERISVGISALRRERLLFRRESASRIHWRRHAAVRIEALGARDVVPIAGSGPDVPEALDRYLPHLAFDPAEPMFEAGLGGSDFMRYPLAPGSEADYRFASGDTSRIRLPDGREVRLLELQLTPRRSDSRLLHGTIWLEANTHAVVQMTFRLARAFDLERDADEAEGVPRIFRPVRADFRYVTVEYGLWEMEWWLPRLVALEGYAQMGRLMRVPVRYERSYSEYRVVGDTLGHPPVRIALAGDSTSRNKRSRCRAAGSLCRKVRVELPEDTAALLTSEHLPPSIFEEGEQFVREDELRDILGRLAQLPGAPADLHPPRLLLPHQRSGLTRYNRIEGLSLGAQIEAGYGRLEAELTGRLGVADLTPRAELGLRHQTPTRALRAATYRRLTPLTARPNPLGLGNSLEAFLFGRDDGDYHDALGIELTGEPAGSGRPWYAWRLYAERQRPLEAEADFSVRHLFSRNAAFRPNLQTDRADQLGAELTLRTSRGLDPKGFRWGAETQLQAETGTFRFGRASVTLSAATPLIGRWRASLETSAGTTAGGAPVQSSWLLGGPATLRGYAPRTLSDESFWRARSELSTAAPVARLALFSDLGWAGPREAFGSGRPLLSAGAGVTLLDGMIRFDIARALREPTGWRVDLTLDQGL